MGGKTHRGSSDWNLYDKIMMDHMNASRTKKVQEKQITKMEWRINDANQSSDG